jgi:nucleoside-diphosphate-sugar epimerase
MRVLLAGGAGFIGSHLAEALVERGDDVVIVDSLVTGRLENLDRIAAHSRVEVIEYDITAPLTSSYLEAVTGRADGRFDVIANLASPASPSDFLSMPLYILDTGAIGSRNLLNLAVEHRARYLFASTSEVYGDPLVHPQPEDYLGNVSTTGPRSCYDEAKRFGEALAMGYHRTHDVQVRIARIFNTFGERMRPEDGRVVNTFIAQALRGEPLTVHGTGQQTRSFCHVSDMVAGLIAVMDGPMVGPVNLGNPSELTIRELANMIIRLTDSPSIVATMDMPAERDGDPVRRCPTIALARDRLGWTPKVSVEEGLRRMIAHFEQHEGLARPFTRDGGAPDDGSWA